MDSSVRWSSDSIKSASDPDKPFAVPSLAEIALRTLMKAKNRITSLEVCSVADAMPVLSTLTFEQLLNIEVHTTRDLTSDPDWDLLWQAQCTRLAIPQAANSSWRQTWKAQDSKRKKYTVKSTQVKDDSGQGVMTSQQVELKKARQEWQKKLRAAEPLPSIYMPSPKKSKYS